MACRFIIGLFVLLYATALILLAIGAWGLFGSERDPLSAFLLVPLGMPWNLLLDRFGDGGNLLVAIFAPAVNLGILVAICRWLR